MPSRAQTPTHDRETRKRQKSEVLQRQYVAVTVTLAVLVLGIIFLFGHLISRSLSRHYLETVLITGQEEAEQLAQEMSDDGGNTVGLYDVVEKRREVIQRRLEGLARKLVFTSITVTDAKGRIVYQADIRSREMVPAQFVEKNLDVGTDLSDSVVRETENSYQIPAPIGSVGEVVLTVSKGQLADRISKVRKQLLRQTMTVAGVTLITLLVAFAFVWHLIQRTQRLEMERREAEELASLGALAANLAHEIRNPLNSINLNLELLEEDLEGGVAEAAASLASTRKEVGRLARLVTDFLTYARPNSMKTEPVRVDTLVREVVTFLKPEARRAGVHLRALDPLPDVEVLGDEGQVRQVLINLVLNAIQALEGLEAERRVVEVTVELKEEYIHLVVLDRGDGVPEDQLGKVTTAFYTRRPGGTGLGLAIAERVARNHGGWIELENLDPHGFVARVVLPWFMGSGKMGAPEPGNGNRRRTG